MAAVIEAALRLDTEGAGLLRSLGARCATGTTAWSASCASATLRDALAGLAAPR